eukprot:SAG31_NODE_2042_length_6589_cov_10.177504_1_plen_89_part_00
MNNNLHGLFARIPLVAGCTWQLGYIGTESKFSTYCITKFSIRRWICGFRYIRIVLNLVTWIVLLPREIYLDRHTKFKCSMYFEVLNYI